jgi:hypothetical protein
MWEQQISSVSGTTDLGSTPPSNLKIASIFTSVAVREGSTSTITSTNATSTSSGGVSADGMDTAHPIGAIIGGGLLLLDVQGPFGITLTGFHHQL